MLPISSALSEEDVATIHAERAKDPPILLRELAARFGVTEGTISRIASQGRHVT
jgi:hypothetical protein